jgi:hypothetical protein
MGVSHMAAFGLENRGKTPVMQIVQSARMQEDRFEESKGEAGEQQSNKRRAFHSASAQMRGDPPSPKNSR